MTIFKIIAQLCSGFLPLPLKWQLFENAKEGTINLNAIAYWSPHVMFDITALKDRQLLKQECQSRKIRKQKWVKNINTSWMVWETSELAAPTTPILTKK